MFGKGPTKVADADYQTTPTGLKYAIITPGDGEPARRGQTVNVHYTGWLENGTKFDSSRDRNQPFAFPLGGGRVIKGWDEGVEGMKPGEKRQLVIPANLGYGSRGAGGAIPPRRHPHLRCGTYRRPLTTRVEREAVPTTRSPGPALCPTKLQRKSPSV